MITAINYDMNYYQSQERLMKYLSDEKKYDIALTMNTGFSRTFRLINLELSALMSAYRQWRQELGSESCISAPSNLRIAGI